MKIAIVKLSALGDIVHAMFVLQVVKKKMPELEIDWIVEEVFAPVLENNPCIHKVYTLNLKSLKKSKVSLFHEIAKLRQYKKNTYDLVIDLQGLLKSAIVAKMLGYSIGFSKNAIRESIAARWYKKTFFVPYEENVIQRNLFLMQKALQIEDDISDMATDPKEPFLFFREEDRELCQSYISSSKKNIIYIVGSSWESKVYPKEKFVEMIQALEGRHLLVWGNEAEFQHANYIASHTEARVMPKMNLNELKALISHADLVIGGDSGPTHFAWALNRPSITVFGPTPSQRNTCITAINKVVDCGKKVNSLRLNKRDFCIRHIEVEKIVTIAKGLLG